jgi:fluoride exporter
MTYLMLIGAGGFAGALARYVVDGRIVHYTGTARPWGTFFINVSGSFALGVLFALITQRPVLPADLIAPVMIGFLGSFTTFSTLTLETWRMLAEGSTVPALVNLGGTLIVGVVAVIAGIALGSWL